MKAVVFFCPFFLLAYASNVRPLILQEGTPRQTGLPSGRKREGEKRTLSREE